MKQVLHFRKIKTEVGLQNVATHNSRLKVYDENGTLLPESSAEWVNPEKSKENIYSQKDLNILQTRKKLCEDLKRKPQKNASAGIELVISASPEFSGDWNKYLEDSCSWAKKKWGSSVIQTSVHFDEKTPHAHILIIPILENEGVKKYSSSKFLGGRSGLRDLQTEFNDKVSQSFGLERGEEGSRATHESLEEYNAKLKNIKETQLIVNKKYYERMEKLFETSPEQLRKGASLCDEVKVSSVKEFYKLLDSRKCKNYTELTKCLEDEKNAKSIPSKTIFKKNTKSQDWDMGY